MHAIEKWYEVIKSDNPDKYDEILAEDCVFLFPQWSIHLKEEER